MADNTTSDHPLIKARKQLDEAEQLRRNGKLQAAKKLCEQMIERHPDYYGALHTLGLVLADIGDFKGALGALTQAQAYLPEGTHTLVALSTVYLQMGTRDLAIECIQKALKIGSADAAVYLTLGKILDEEKDYDRASEAYSKAIHLEPNWREPQLLLAFCHENLGDVSASRKILIRRLEGGDKSLGVLAGLLQLPAHSDDPPLREIFSQLSIDERDPRYLFARAQVRSRAGNVEGAWRDLVAANAKRAEEFTEQRASHRIWQDQSLRYATDFGRSAVPGDTGYPYSLMILGPSRAGKTSVEAIIAQGSLVNRGYENSIPVQVARKAFRMAGYPTSFQWPLLPKPLEGMIKEDYKRLLLARSSTARVFTNTTPSRIHDITRMFSIIPNTRAIFVKRKMNDAAFKIYSKNYAAGNFYAYDLNDIYSHLKWYNKMIDLISDQYPEQCAVIDYETVIADPNVAVQAARRLCGDLGAVPAVQHARGDVGCSDAYFEFMASAS
jgi:tetratricopeptide (TPR) repeat protein